MRPNDPASIPTRQSLLERLKDLGNQEDWRRFFDTYWRLIHATAVKAGLTETEAEEVVQEVMIAAAKKLPEFTYQPGKDSLKGWLLAVTRWKVNDQYRKRRGGCRHESALSRKMPDNLFAVTVLIARRRVHQVQPEIQRPPEGRYACLQGNRPVGQIADPECRGVESGSAKRSVLS